MARFDRARFFQWLSALIGDVAWSPPPWWQRLRERATGFGALRARLRGALAVVLAWVRAHPRQLRIAGIATAVAAVAVLGGYLWYQLLPKAVEYSVSGTTPGATRLEDGARPDSITISFGGSAARLEQVDKVVTQGIQISPPIAGEWRWQGDAQLIFAPKEDWGVGQDYVVRLDESLFPDHVRLETYEHRFTSAPFELDLSQVELYQDPKNPKIKKIVATVRFSHPVDAADFEKRITLRLAGQREGLFGIGAESSRFTVSYNKYKGEAYIHSDPVGIRLRNLKRNANRLNPKLQISNSKLFLVIKSLGNYAIQ